MKGRVIQRVAWGLVIASALIAAAYEGSGYLIGAIYGGAMKAYRAKHTPPNPKPPGWATNNVYLGRWRGLSPAGMAVIGVLTVEPNRIRWGHQAHGLCDSDYQVEPLTGGRHGTYPDQLEPPSPPTDLVDGVVRLSLKPRPCSSGDAVIQLAVSLDGSNHLQVNTYDANGKLMGRYGSFEPIRN